MLILVPPLLLFITALALAISRVIRPTFRFGWLVAISGSLAALLIVLFWQVQIPFDISLPPWQLAVFSDTPSFRADGFSWPYAISITALALGILLTSVVRSPLVNSFAWAGTLALSGLGILAATAENPLTLLLAWAALDLTELVTQLRSVDNPSASERVVITFSARATGIGLLLWANIVSASTGSTLDFGSISPQTGLLLVAAAGLRLGVLPLNLPYPTVSNLRRGFGTALRLIPAASSLALLAKIPEQSAGSFFTNILFLLTVIAGIYGGWMWLRAPDELTGRPFWITGIAALAVSCALGSNRAGAAAWSSALVIVGGALFLATAQHVWVNRALLAGAWSLSSLPFSLTASVWGAGTYGFFLPFLIVAQALLTAGFVRHALRSGGMDSLDSQPDWTRKVYPAGIGLILLTQLLLGLFGWDGARQIGFLLAAAASSLLTFGLVWAAPRLRLLNPVRAHWVKPASSWLDRTYRGLWGLYQWLGRISQAVTATLEGGGGIMWTLLFMVLFISLMTQVNP
jgi:hypothetical protein